MIPFFTTFQIGIEQPVKELDCEKANAEDKLCGEYAVQTVNCTNLNFKIFSHPKWKCYFNELSAKVHVNWQLVKCARIDEKPDQLAYRYGVGTCHLRYDLKLNSDDQNNQNPNGNPDENGQLNDPHENGGLLWLYIAGGCVAFLFFLIGMLIFFNSTISDLCTRANCCQTSYSRESLF